MMGVVVVVVVAIIGIDVSVVSVIFLGVVDGVNSSLSTEDDVDNLSMIFDDDDDDVILAV